MIGRRITLCGKRGGTSRRGVQASYCYRSLCIGEAQAAMERCIETDRKVGVHREFYVFSDRQFCVYLSAEVRKYAFDYAMWLSP